jgi:hypothetical protein
MPDDDKDLENQTTETETEPESDLEVETEPTTTTAKTQEEPVDENQDFFKAVLELDPAAKDLVGQYKSVGEYVKGMHEAKRLIGRRNEEAELGRLLKGNQNEFLEFLASKEKRAAPTSDKQSPPTAQEYELLQARTIDPRTRDFRSDAKPEDVKRYLDVQTELNRRIVEMAFRPEEAFRDMFDQVRGASTQEMSQRLSDEQAVDEFKRTHGKWYYADGTGQTSNPSSRGEEFAGYLKEAADEGIRTAKGQLRYALRALKAEHGIEAIESTPSKRTANAKRKTNTAPAEVDLEDEAALEKMPYSEYVKRRLAAGATEI